MPTNYTVRREAKEDVSGIWLYSAERWGLDQADRYLQQLSEKFAWLAENPGSGHLRDDIIPPAYCMPCGSHLVFYDIYDSHIDIIRVLHQRADLVDWMTH